MILAIVLLSALPGILSYNILCVFPYQAPSHQTIFHSVIRVLLKSGHNVTNLTPVSMNENYTNYNEILTPYPQISWKDLFDYTDEEYMSPQLLRKNIYNLADLFMKYLFNSEEWKNLLKSPKNKYDAIFLQIFFMQEQLVFLGHLFQAPVVSVSTLDLMPLEEYISDNTRNPGEIPLWEMYAPQGMTFLQRVQNTLWWLTGLIEQHLIYLPERQESILRVFNQTRETIPYITELLSDVALHICNSHPIVYYPRPVYPNVIYAPGLFISAKPTMQKSFQMLMDNANEGVILFTLGSISPISKLSEKVKIAFVNAFKRLPFLILWKSDIIIPEVSDNVKFVEWIPQQAILAHKNCKLFLTHGGLLGKQEAIYHGVPMITIPFYGDQKMNAAQTEGLGLGLTLFLKDITEQTVFDSISSVLNKQSFRENAKQLSIAFQHEVSESPKKINYWIEEIIKKKVILNHIKTNSNLNVFQKYLLDIAFIILVIIHVLIYLFYKCISIYMKKSKSVNQKIKFKTN